MMGWTRLFTDNALYESYGIAYGNKFDEPLTDSWRLHRRSPARTAHHAAGCIHGAWAGPSAGRPEMWFAAKAVGQRTVYRLTDGTLV